MSGPDGDLQDRALLAAHLAGTAGAFDELVRRHQDRLYAVAVRTCGDREQAADALQDALVSALRSAASYRGEARVTTWLHRIVVNACLDLARRRAARPTTALPLQLPADPRDLLGERESALVVEAALQALPQDQRVAVVLVHLQGFSVEEASAVLGVPSGTVKSRCSRGRARLAVTLGHLRNPDQVPGVLPRVHDHPGLGAPTGPPVTDTEGQGA